MEESVDRLAIYIFKMMLDGPRKISRYRKGASATLRLPILRNTVSQPKTA